MDKSLAVQQPKKLGAPSKYTDRKADLICREISQGKSLKAVCDDLGLNMTTITRWLNDERYQDFRTKYTYARKLQAEYFADQTIEIADDIDDSSMASVQKGRIRIESRQWAASKLAPKKYGDKADDAGGTPVGVPLLQVLIQGDNTTITTKPTDQ